MKTLPRFPTTLVLAFMSIGFIPATLFAQATTQPDPQPTLSSTASWPRLLAIVVIGLFIAAAVIGPLVRKYATPEKAEADSHDAHAGHDSPHGH